MFYQVKVLDGKGNIKKVVSSKELSKRYWDSFHNTAANEQPDPAQSKARKKVRSHFKQMPEVYGNHN